MKKFASIGLLALLLFNLVGFRLVFEAAIRHSDQGFESRLDLGAYDEKDLVPVRVPLSMPYQTANKGFERVRGQMTVGGTVYHYVGRKIENGDLILLCLSDDHGSALRMVRDSYLGNTNAAPQPIPIAPGANLGDYDGYTAEYTFSLSLTERPAACPAGACLLQGIPFLPEKPPREAQIA